MEMSEFKKYGDSCIELSEKTRLAKQVEDLKELHTKYQEKVKDLDAQTLRLNISERYIELNDKQSEYNFHKFIFDNIDDSDYIGEKDFSYESKPEYIKLIKTARKRNSENEFKKLEVEITNVKVFLEELIKKYKTFTTL